MGLVEVGSTDLDGSGEGLMYTAGDGEPEEVGPTGGDEVGV